MGVEAIPCATFHRHLPDLAHHDARRSANWPVACSVGLSVRKSPLAARFGEGAASSAVTGGEIANRKSRVKVHERATSACLMRGARRQAIGEQDSP